MVALFCTKPDFKGSMEFYRWKKTLKIIKSHHQLKAAKPTCSHVPKHHIHTSLINTPKAHTTASLSSLFQCPNALIRKKLSLPTAVGPKPQFEAQSARANGLFAISVQWDSHYCLYCYKWRRSTHPSLVALHVQSTKNKLCCIQLIRDSLAGGSPPKGSKTASESLFLVNTNMNWKSSCKVWIEFSWIARKRQIVFSCLVTSQSPFLFTGNQLGLLTHVNGSGQSINFQLSRGPSGLEVPLSMGALQTIPGTAERKGLLGSSQADLSKILRSWRSRRGS